MRRLLHTLGALLLSLGVVVGCNTDVQAPQTTAFSRHGPAVSGPSGLDTRGLPPEAVTVIETIQRGGPFPYRKDGSTFQNRERRLPDRPRGFYREYTVPTPGERTRGARRIVTGGEPPRVYYYTPDHYRSFKKIPELR